ncbi:MAG: DUF1015 domain-containing protein [Candidatus Sumerlaeia bacterium]|nr:DUF1015 domain-containing protein [Candidatus Sumerlaeia bacterium]
MPEIVPFIGTRYDSRVAGNLGLLICPPYDCITPAMQQQLYDRHKKNYVRLVLGKDLATDDEYNNRYERSARYFREWKQEGILTEDEELSFYFCEQEFTLPSGEKRIRRGFHAAVKLEEGPQGRIRAHEHTFPGPKADRLKLLRATQCNLCPIFCLCPDPKKRLQQLICAQVSTPPLEEFTDFDGVVTRLWICQNPADIQKIQEVVRDQSFLIADGHHRYETALAYRAEMRQAVGKKHKNMPFDYVMMYLTSLEDEGLVILPTHRALIPELGVGVDLKEVMSDLENYFTVEPVSVDFDQPEKSAPQLLEQITPRRPRQIRLAMLLPNRSAYILTLKSNVKTEEMMGLEDLPPAIRNLDVSILHQFIINQVWIGNPEIELDQADVFYSRNAAEILDKVKRRHCCAAFLLNAPRIEQVQEIAEAGLRMPHKSTFFYPKVPSGIVARDISRHQ